MLRPLLLAALLPVALAADPTPAGVAPAATVADASVSPAGLRLARRIDATGVNRRWLAGRRVDWRTGADLGPAPDDGKPHTHCSAFVAAFTLECGVPLPRPPDYRLTLLASTQARWLENDGARHGWTALAGPAEAQRRANAGELVLAAYASPDPTTSGHIALVRPAAIAAAALAQTGPRLAQAGKHNGADLSLREGFAAHRGATRPGAVKFYAHPLTPAPTPPEAR